MNINHGHKKVIKILQIQCPYSITVDSVDGKPINVTYPAIQISGGASPYQTTYNPISGSLFSVGTSTVSVVVKSADGQIQSCSFMLIVRSVPAAPPVIPPVPGAHPSIWLDTVTRTLLLTKAAISDSDYLATKAAADSELGRSVPSFTVASVTNANPAQFTLLEDIPWAGSYPIYIAGGTGAWAGINNDTNPGLTATKTGTKTFTVPINSSGFGSFSGQTVCLFPYDGSSDYTNYGFEGFGWQTSIQPLALLYQITGNVAYANKAIAWLRFVSSYGKLGLKQPIKIDSYFPTRAVMLALAQAYDWCYPLLTAQDKSDAIAAINFWYDSYKAEALDIDGPASSNYFTGHLLGVGLAGLATIGDNIRAAEINSYIRAKVDTIISPAFSAGEMRGGGMFEAYGYGTNAWERFLWYLIGLRTATTEDLLTTTTWIKTLAKNLIYNLNPNRWQASDEADYPGNYVGIINKSYPITLQYGLQDLTEGKWMRYLYQNVATNPYGAGAGEPVFVRLLWYDSSKAIIDYRSTEPTVYASLGDYHIINRDNWNDTAIWSSLNGQSTGKAGHQTRAAGNLRIVRGNDLIMPYAGQWKGNTGVVEDGVNPNVFDLSGVYANTLYHKDGGVYNFYNAGSQAYAGGQGYWGADNVLGQEANAVENYSYQKSDLTSAYYNNSGSGGRTLDYFIRAGFLDGAIQVLFDRLNRTSITYTDRFQWHYNRQASYSQAGGIVMVSLGVTKHFYKPLLPASSTIVLTNDTTDPLDAEFGGSPANTTKRVTVSDATNPASILGLHAFYTGASGLGAMPATTLLTPTGHYAAEVVDGADTKIYVFSSDGTDKDSVTVTP